MIAARAFGSEAAFAAIQPPSASMSKQEATLVI
jgi:hypothetical protein